MYLLGICSYFLAGLRGFLTVPKLSIERPAARFLHPPDQIVVDFVDLMLRKTRRP